MSDASDSGERKTVIMGKAVTSDMVLKTLGGILLVLFGFTLNKTWDKITTMETKLDGHEARLIKSEMRSEQVIEAVNEIKSDVKDIKREIKKP